MISWQIDNPSPVPCAFSSSFSKRLNILFWFSLEIPQPVSLTEKRAVSSVCFTSSRVIVPCAVNFVALISRLISTCCRRALSVVSFSESREVENRTSAWVCFIFSTMSMTFLHSATISHSLNLNCIFPISRLDKSITSLISLSSSSEFCWMISLHCCFVSLSMDSSVRIAEKPDKALSGVRISWLILERKRLLVWIDFSACFLAFSCSCCDCRRRLLVRLMRKIAMMISTTITRITDRLQ